MRREVSQGVLTGSGIPFPRAYDLAVLLKLLLPAQPSLAPLRPALDTLTAYAIDVRYPGQVSTKVTARQALKLCRLVRREFRVTLLLPP
jgi:hypothetical protein